MLKFRADDFGADDAVYALRNYLWDVRQELKRLRSLYGFVLLLFGVVMPVVLFIGDKLDGSGIIISLFIATVFATLWLSAWANLWNTNKNIEILQAELHRRGLG